MVFVFVCYHVFRYILYHTVNNLRSLSVIRILVTPRLPSLIQSESPTLSWKQATPSGTSDPKVQSFVQLHQCHHHQL